MNILIVDDEISQVNLLDGFLKKQGFTTFTATSPIDALTIIKKNSIDLVISDYKMPELTGEELFLEIKKINPEIKFIMLTAFGSIETAVNVLKHGAVDFIEKPVNLETLIQKIQDIEEKHIIENSVTVIENKIGIKIPFKNKKILEIYNTINKIATSDINVLILGESGTGKEVIAKTIHNLSKRADKPFVAVNCAAIPENLFESEFFGYEKGAFTGAVSKKKGKFFIANNGTIFLDEICEIPVYLQSKLLRVLQEKEIEPLGSEKTIPVNVRIISATNRDIKEMVKNEEFREDLYYRLNVVSLNLPPLRERREDIPVFIDYFLKNFSNNRITVSPEARDLLIKYHYPGNIRELENIIQRAIALCSGNVIKTKDLPEEVKLAQILENDSNVNLNLNKEIEKLEKKLILDALESSQWNKSKAAELLGINERVIRYKVKKYNL